MNSRLDFAASCAPLWAVSIVLGLAAIFFGARIHLPLLEPEEARYAEIPRQMLVHQRFLIPIHDGQDYLDKPPLLYWAVMASYRLFGVHDWSARLPAILAAWSTVCVLLVWGWRTAAPAVGVAAAALLTLCGDFVYRAPMLTMNGPLAFFVAAALAAGHIALLRGDVRWRWWLASAAFCGLGILTKGPVAAALVVVPLFAWSRLDVSLGRPARRHWLAWTGSALAVAGPWLIAVMLQRPDFVQYFFWKHHVERFATPFDHAGPLWAYLPQIALGFMPWTLLAVPVAWWRRSAPYDNGQRIALLAFTAGIWGFALFSLAGSKRPVYLIAIEPPLALATAAYLWNARAALRRSIWLAIGMTTALAIGAGVFVWLPAYSQQFSVASVVQLAKGSNLPVFCYGHGWDSIGFYFENNDVKTFLADNCDNITPELAAHDRSIIFVTTKRAGDAFIDKLPPGFTFEVLSSSRQAHVGIVTSPKTPSSDKP